MIGAVVICMEGQCFPMLYIFNCPLILKFPLKSSLLSTPKQKLSLNSFHQDVFISVSGTVQNEQNRF